MPKTEKSMNVYQKVQKVRTELVDLSLKKTGKNTFSNFTYYELGDFLPSLNRLMDKYGLMTRFVIVPKNANTPEKAILEVFNSAKPEEKIVFFSETADVAIGKKKDGTGGADPIQNLGGKITYMRRYVMMMAFEIVESDAVDVQNQKKVEALELDKDSIEKINKAKDLEELAQISKDIGKKKGPKFRTSLVAAYTVKKAELE